VVLALLAPLPFLVPAGAPATLAVLVAPLLALFSLRLSGAAFSGIGGDVVGATGEVCRAVVLVALSAML
jgi:cobalamin synthase